jgi:hypothetical protein
MFLCVNGEWGEVEFGQQTTRRPEHPPRGVGSSALSPQASNALLPRFIGREHLASSRDDQRVRRGAMLGSVPLDGCHTADPEILGEAVSVHRV